MEHSMSDFIWTVRNNLSNPIHIPDLGPNGLLILKGESVPLHERYSLDALQKSRHLSIAIKNNNLKEIKKELNTNQPQHTQQSDDIDKLQHEISDIKQYIKSLSDSTLQTKSITPSGQSQGLSKDDLIKILSEFNSSSLENTNKIIQESLSNALNNISILQPNNIDIESNNQYTVSPDDISTKFITDNSINLADSATIKNNKEIRETIIDQDMSDIEKQLEELL